MAKHQRQEQLTVVMVRRLSVQLVAHVIVLIAGHTIAVAILDFAMH